MTQKQTTRTGIEPVVYGAGIGVALIGSLASYTLFLAGRTSEAGAVMGVTVAAALGVILIIGGTLLRAQREGRESVVLLLFGAGLFVALIGSLVSYELYLCRALSKAGALAGVTVAAALAVLLVNVGVLLRVRYIEERRAKRVVMKPFHRLRPRDVRGGSPEWAGKEHGNG
jgi:hypothetical protein